MRVDIQLAGLGDIQHLVRCPLGDGRQRLVGSLLVRSHDFSDSGLLRGWKLDIYDRDRRQLHVDDKSLDQLVWVHLGMLLRYSTRALLHERSGQLLLEGVLLTPYNASMFRVLRMAGSVIAVAFVILLAWIVVIGPVIFQLVKAH